MDRAAWKVMNEVRLHTVVPHAVSMAEIPSGHRWVANDVRLYIAYTTNPTKAPYV